MQVLSIDQSTYAASWATNAAMNSPRYHHTATLLPDGRILVTGGAIADQYTFTNSAEIYDPATGIWTLTPPMHHSREFHTATLLNDGTVFVFGGGENPVTGDNTPETYNPSTGLWTTNNTSTVLRRIQTATLLPSGLVLIAGGWGVYNYTGGATFGPQALAELYDPATGNWTNAGFMNISRYNHTATLLPNGKVLVAGGFTSNGTTALTSAELFDSNTRTWTNTGSMLEPYAFHEATLLPNGKVLVEPALDGNLNFTTNAELYDPSTGTWSNTSGVLVTPSIHEAILLPNGKVLAACAASSSTEIYDPADQTWSLSDTMTVNRVLSKATLLRNGNVLATGGYSGGALASTELYNSSNIAVSAFNSISAVKPSAGAFQFSFTNTPDVSFLVYSATNLFLPLNAWTIIGGAIETAPGQYQFTDTQATNSGQRFYRIRSP